MPDAQDQIVAAVRERGYLSGWSDGQIAARQVAKLTEELRELVQACTLPGRRHRPGWLLALDHAGLGAQQAFDDPLAWDGAEVDINAAWQEIADMAVVLFVLADHVGMGLVEAALYKARNDVQRGVRNGG